jgi:hypothetical protein
MLATTGFSFAAVTPPVAISLQYAAALTLFATIGVLILLIVTATLTNKKEKTSQQAQPQKKRSSPPASWHKPSHRSRKQQYKVYVAPVIKRKWRTPRRSSH